MVTALDVVAAVFVVSSGFGLAALLVGLVAVLLAVVVFMVAVVVVVMVAVQCDGVQSLLGCGRLYEMMNSRKMARVTAL